MSAPRRRSELDVTVVEGSVLVRAEGQGDPARARRASMPATGFSAEGEHPSRVQKLAPGALDDALAWREGQMVFDGTPLQEALNRFAHYHGREIAVAPDAASAPGGRKVQPRRP